MTHISENPARALSRFIRMSFPSEMLAEDFDDRVEEAAKWLEEEVPLEHSGNN